MKHIKEAGNHLLELINNVLEMSRIESGKTVLEDNDLCDIRSFDNMVDSVFGELLHKKMTMIRSLEKALKIWMRK